MFGKYELLEVFVFYLGKFYLKRVFENQNLFFYRNEKRIKQTKGKINKIKN